jgi:nucleoside-diphosphate-sugar epimerase
MPANDPARLVLVGATGRVGRMVAAHWHLNPPAGLAALTQDRAGALPGALAWAPLDGPGPLVAEVARGGPVAALVVLAGVVPGPGADLSLNAALAVACLRAAQAAGVRRVLVASSSAVYGAGDGLAEGAALAPLNPYGAAKVAMEAACDPFRAAGLEVCALRIGNVAGADALLVNVARGGALAIDRFADGGGPVRSYIGPGTLAAVLAGLAMHPGPLPPALNIAAPQPVAMADLAAAAGAAWAWVEAPATAAQRITLDCAALARLHPFTPSDSTPAAMVAQWREATA